MLFHKKLQQVGKKSVSNYQPRMMGSTTESQKQLKGVTKLKKLKQFMKAIKSKVVKSKKKCIKDDMAVHQDALLKYSHSDSSFRVTLKPLKQAKSVCSGSEYESEYEEMTSDYCTLPRKKMKYRMKQKVFEKSLNAILLEARREIIEESSSSGDEGENEYVACGRENSYAELKFENNFEKIPEDDEGIYEEIRGFGSRILS